MGVAESLNNQAEFRKGEVQASVQISVNNVGMSTIPQRAFLKASQAVSCGETLHCRITKNRRRMYKKENPYF